MRRPFTRASALKAGVSPSSLRGKNFRRLFTGVYVHASVPMHPLLWVQAALLIHPPSAFASHMSAGRVFDVPLPSHPHEHVSVLHRRDRRHRDGIRHHISVVDPAVVVVRGLRVSGPEQLFVELAETLDLVDLVVVGDDLVRRKLTTPAKLRAACAASTCRRAKAARRAAAYVRQGVDSPMESRLRMLIVLAGLPEPAVDHRLFHSDGRLRYRFDLSYPELRLAVEYDGRQHRDDLDQWDHDTTRRDWMDHHDWMLVPVFSRGIYQRPHETIERVRDALERRGCRSLPRVLSEEWRRHFAVRVTTSGAR